MLQLPDSARVPIQSLSRIFSNMSESYKIFWFKALMNLITSGKQKDTFSDIINHMITDAWYMVSEYKLNLGPADTLEKLVLYTQQVSGLKSSAKPQEVLDFLHRLNDPKVDNYKKVLSLNVPYRLQAPFMPDFKGSKWDSPSVVLDRINCDKGLIYHFSGDTGLSREIIFQPDWIAYLSFNQAIVLGWIEFNMIQYLQKRNPSVPGISNKLYPPTERKLEKAKAFWKAVAIYEPVANIYSATGECLTTKDISLDHFVPWSYVAHDELWDLVPTTKSLNSSKSNNLPDWNKYFPLLCNIEYTSYHAIWKSESIHKLFENCKREHVNSNEALMKLYWPGIDQSKFSAHLEELILPTYTAAKNLGFGVWSGV